MSQKRNSSFELLRIILIIMILVEHGNMWFIGGASASESEHLAKCIVETLCIGAVNAFVLISGWFGIRSGLKKIGGLIFMLLFCTVPVLIIALGLGWIQVAAINSIGGIYEYILGGNAYWFVIDYIGLLIMSPILNKGIQGMDKRRFGVFLVASYSLILIYDFVFRAPVLGSEGGYSVLWFVFLYLLARYIRIFGLGTFGRFACPILIGAVALQSALFYWGVIGMRYTNPLILIESICLIVIFKDWNFHNAIINYAATGCLMAYMLHMQPVFVPFIKRFLLGEYSICGYGFYMIEVVGLSFGVFLIAVLLNKIQSILFRRIKNACHCSNADL